MKKVYRSRHTKVLGGVAAGLAEYFNMDVTVMRLLFALLLVTLPNTFFAYILAWIIIPEEPVGASVSLPGSGTGGAMMTEKVESPTTGMTADEILESRGEPVVPDIPQANASPGTPGPSAGTAPAPQASPEVSKGRSDRGRQLLGYILIAIGAAVMFRKYVPNFVWTFPFRLIGQAWPVLIILAGIAIIFGAVRGR